jgi:hypothetical protein
LVASMAMVGVGLWLGVERSAGGVAVIAQRRVASCSPRSGAMHACWGARRMKDGGWNERWAMVDAGLLWFVLYGESENVLT